MSRVPRAQLAPRDLAVAVGVEREHVVEIAQRDVPLPAQRRAVALEGQVGVARLVRRGRRDGRRAPAGRPRASASWPAPGAGHVEARAAIPVREALHGARVAGGLRGLDEDRAGRPARAARPSWRAPARARPAHRLRSRAGSAPPRVGAGCRRAGAPRRSARASAARCAAKSAARGRAGAARRARCAAAARRCARRRARRASASAGRPASSSQSAYAALQVGVARVERERGAEVRLGGSGLGAARRDLAGESQCPHTDAGIDARPREEPGQLAVRGVGVAGRGSPASRGTRRRPARWCGRRARRNRAAPRRSGRARRAPWRASAAPGRRRAARAAARRDRPARRRSRAGSGEWSRAARAPAAAARRRATTARAPPRPCRGSAGRRSRATPRSRGARPRWRARGCADRSPARARAARRRLSDGSVRSGRRSTTTSSAAGTNGVAPTGAATRHARQAISSSVFIVAPGTRAGRGARATAGVRPYRDCFAFCSFTALSSLGEPFNGARRYGNSSAKNAGDRNAPSV